MTNQRVPIPRSTDPRRPVAPPVPGGSPLMPIEQYGSLPSRAAPAVGNMETMPTITSGAPGGGVPPTRPEMDRYLQLAEGFTGRSTQDSTSSMGQGVNMRQLAQFARTPAGKAAIQGAVDSIIAQRKGGMTADTNPYKHIIMALRAGAQMTPTTA